MNVQPATAFDTWTGVASAALYLLVGLAVLARAPKDARARTFFTIALASLAPYLLPALMGGLGAGAALTVAALATGISLAVGSVALFHFTQVFPSRRAWIRSNGPWLLPTYLLLALGGAVSAYVLLPLITFVAQVESSTGSGGLGAVSSGAALFLLVVVIPTIFVVGIVLPFGALLSLYKSWQEAKRDGRDAARVITLTILISQLAGGALTILIVPLLHLVAPNGASVRLAAVLLFGCSLLFPVAFAVGVWTYGLVDRTRDM